LKITGSGKDYKIELKINNFEINLHQFKYIKIKEKLHNDLPECEIGLNIFQEDLKHFLKIGSKIEFKFKVGDKSDKYEFFQTSFEFVKDKRKFKLKIKGVLYVPDYFQNSFQQAFFKDKTTKKLFSTISTVTPKVLINTDTNDKQTWIRPNYTDKNWFEYLYNFSFISTDDLVICGLNFKKELIINNLKNILSKKPKLISNIDKKGIIKYQTYTFKKSLGILDYKMSPLRKVRTFDIPTHQISEFDLPNKSLFTGKVYNDLKKYYPFKILLNDFNTYPRYLYAYRYNQVMRKRLEFFKFYLELFTDKLYDIELLDFVEFKEKDEQTEKIIETTAGTYIVGEKEIVFNEQKIISQKIVLYRDYFL
jgi:hypothetical protein